MYRNINVDAVAHDMLRIARAIEDDLSAAENTSDQQMAMRYLRKAMMLRKRQLSDMAEGLTSDIDTP